MKNALGKGRKQNYQPQLTGTFPHETIKTNTCRRTFPLCNYLQSCNLTKQVGK